MGYGKPVQMGAQKVHDQFRARECSVLSASSNSSVSNPAESTAPTIDMRTHQLWTVLLSGKTFVEYAERYPHQVLPGSSIDAPLALFWYNNPHTTLLTAGDDVVVNFPFSKDASLSDTDYSRKPHLGVLVALASPEHITHAIPKLSQQVLRRALVLETARRTVVSSKQKKSAVARMHRREAQREATRVALFALEEEEEEVVGFGY